MFNVKTASQSKSDGFRKENYKNWKLEQLIEVQKYSKKIQNDLCRFHKMYY